MIVASRCSSAAGSDGRLRGENSPASPGAGWLATAPWKGALRQPAPRDIEGGSHVGTEVVGPTWGTGDVAFSVPTWGTETRPFGALGFCFFRASPRALAAISIACAFVMIRRHS